MQDLAHLASGSLAVSSMSGGNTVSGSKVAQTAPGSPPVDPMPDQDDQADPAITVTPSPRSVLTHGTGDYTPVPLTWKVTTDG